MSKVEKEAEKKKFGCFADYVVDVPKLIINLRLFTLYERLQMLGSGTYSKCYEIARKLTAKPFACKILNKVIMKDCDLKHLVTNEISIHRKLKHKHVVQFVESFEDDKYIYMIQSLCPNLSLKDLQHNRGILAMQECRYFINQILKGIEYIHDNGVIHRDLKLSNILIDEQMQMKIGDFGLAIHISDPRLASKSLCGTTNYLAPEVVNRKGFKQRSDIWAVGVIAYVLIFGHKPFEEGDLYATHQRIVKANYKIPPNTDEHFKSFLKSVFEKDVERRPSAEDCLKLDFFQKYIIPDAIPDEIFYQPLCAKEMKKEPTTLSSVKVSESPTTNPVKYPDLRIQAQPLNVNALENAAYVQMLKNVFERFDAICRFHTSDCDLSLSEISELSDMHPDYWITKWFFDAHNGFVYQVCDETIGMLFHDGLKIIRTPSQSCLAFEPGDERFEEIPEPFNATDLKPDLDIFFTAEQKLKKNGHFEAETRYIQALSPHLVTWIQTYEAMVMLLSNHTIPINFAKNHQKMLICPQNETITMIHGKISRSNFKTLKFATMASHSFSVHSFQLFKYVTAAIKQLSLKFKTSKKL